MKRKFLFILILFTSLILVGCAHEHQYTENVVAPTCVEKGYTAYSCQECDYVYLDKEINAKGHSFGDWVVIKAATETEEGIQEKTCLVCGTTEQKTIVSLNHTHKYNTTQYVAPTCEEVGYTIYKCDCGESYNDKEVEALGHVLETVKQGKEATCIETGYTSETKCIRCGKVNESEEITKLPHNEVVLEAKEATCDEAGLTEGKQCKDCGIITVSQTTVAPHAHKVIDTAAIAPTCTTNGSTAGKVCTICYWFTVKPEILPATGHIEEVLEEVLPTCTEKGKTEGIKCSICNVILIAQEEIAATGHIEEVLEAVESTCTQTGLTEGKKCLTCNEILVIQDVVEVKAHIEQLIPAVQGTCTNPGLTAGKKCTVCDTITLEQKPIINENHNKVIYICKEHGNHYIIYCKSCGLVFFEIKCE